ncbi:unnamed protein product [Phytophthora fragariaefolia]|uniref:Unnamed protein product n=1 Tax=Phytophthora fragariaefolia TaxID=1490495 RepID=A0A9W7CWM7_9STRA|nr:unnamed protein product [Phytophthora fragariaefolia]
MVREEREVVVMKGLLIFFIVVGDVELTMDEEGVSTGEIHVRAHTPVDKERWIAELRSRHAEKQPTVVYVGDSANDLLAMLEADVGVWLNSDKTLSSSKLLGRLVEYYGIETRPLKGFNSLQDCVDVNAERQVHLDLRSVGRLAFDASPLADDRVPADDGKEHARVVLDSHALKDNRMGNSCSWSDSHACCDCHVRAQLRRRVHVGRGVDHHIALDNRRQFPASCTQGAGVGEPEPLHVELRARDSHARRLDLAPKVAELEQHTSPPHPEEKESSPSAPEVVEVAELREELLEVVLRVGLGAGLAAQPLAADLVPHADDRVHERHVEEVDPAVDDVADERLGLLGPVQDLLAHGVGHEAAVLLGLVVEHALSQHGAGALVLEVEVHHLVEREGAAHVAVQHEEAGGAALEDLVAEEADAAGRAQRLVLAQVADGHVEAAPDRVEEAREQALVVRADHEDLLQVGHARAGLDVEVEHLAPRQLEQRLGQVQRQRPEVVALLVGAADEDHGLGRRERAGLGRHAAAAAAAGWASGKGEDLGAAGLALILSEGAGLRPPPRGRNGNTLGALGRLTACCSLQLLTRRCPKR